MAWAAVIGAGGAILGGVISSKGNKKSTEAANAAQKEAIEAAKMDPRMQGMLYGDGSPKLGLLQQATDLANRPQSEGSAAFGKGMDDYLKNSGMNTFNGSLGAAQGLQSSAYAAPQMQAATGRAGPGVSAAQNGPMQGMNAANINAPRQNGMNLDPAFNQMIYGDQGANPYLTGAIQSGIDQSTDAFKAMQKDATQNLTENILPSIRSNSIMSGGFGGSRQALAEGGALGKFSDEMGRALTQFGRNNTGAAVTAQAGSFNQGQDRALNALGALNGNQYGVAGQNAAFQQQAGSQNSSQSLNNGQFNTGLLQQAAMQNGNWMQQFGMANLNNQQQANGANQQAQIGTNALNSGNIASGIGLTNGLLGQAYNYGTAQDNRDLTRLGQSTGILAQFDKGGGQVAQPYFNNSAGAALGGAQAGLGLASQFAGMFGGNSGFSNQKFGYVPPAQTYTPSLTQSIDYNALGNQALNFKY